MAGSAFSSLLLKAHHLLDPELQSRGHAAPPHRLKALSWVPQLGRLKQPDGVQLPVVNLPDPCYACPQLKSSPRTGTNNLIPKWKGKNTQGRWPHHFCMQWSAAHWPQWPSAPHLPSLGWAPSRASQGGDLLPASNDLQRQRLRNRDKAALLPPPPLFPGLVSRPWNHQGLPRGERRAGDSSSWPTPRPQPPPATPSALLGPRGARSCKGIQLLRAL